MLYSEVYLKKICGQHSAHLPVRADAHDPDSVSSLDSDVDLCLDTTRTQNQIKALDSDMDRELLVSTLRCVSRPTVWMARKYLGLDTRRLAINKTTIG